MQNNIETEASEMVVRSQSVAIVTKEDYQNAATFILSLKDLSKRIRGVYEPLVENAHKAHKFAKAQMDEKLRPVEMAETELKMKVKAYERKIEEERIAAQQAAEQEAIEAQARDRAALLAEADDNKWAGNDAHATQLTKIANSLDYRPTAVEDERIKGLGIRKSWKFKIVNEDLIPNEFLMPDEVYIGKIVRATKGTKQIPGVLIYED